MLARTAWDRFADSYLDRVFSAIAFPDKRERLIQLTPPGSVLDFGCGPLPFLVNDLLRPSNRSVIACDFSLSMITALRTSLDTQHARLLLADGQALPLRTSSLDAVLAINSIVPEERDQVDLIVAEVARVIRPGGRLVAILPAFEMSLIAARSWGIDIQLDLERHREYDTTGWQCYFTEGDITLLMTRHGFSQFVIERLYFTSDEQTAMIRHVYGQRIPPMALLAHPLFEHLLFAIR